MVDAAVPPPKGGTAPAPIFGPCLLWPNGWMGQDATWYDGRPWPGQHCVRCRPSSTPRGTAPQIVAHVCCGQMTRWIKMPPIFCPMCIVARRLPISATAEHLLKCSQNVRSVNHSLSCSLSDQSEPYHKGATQIICGDQIKGNIEWNETGFSFRKWLSSLISICLHSFLPLHSDPDLTDILCNPLSYPPDATNFSSTVYWPIIRNNQTF